MSAQFDYQTLIKRNRGYISDEAQNAIAETRLLIAESESVPDWDISS